LGIQAQVRGKSFAAMQVPDFLEHLEEGDLIITPSDRADIILACAENPGNRA
jgi:phosphate acetyltransferase